MAKLTRKNLAIAKVYLKAAELMFIRASHREIPIYGCRAIRSAAYAYKHDWLEANRFLREFGRFFRGNHSTAETWWDEYHNAFFYAAYLSSRQCFRQNIKIPENQKLLTQRTIALCLMAILAKDGQLDI
jgi:hypothetical protein